MQCPGQDNRYWAGKEVFESSCPHCGNIIEFFKDDSQRTCGKCGHRVLNPKIDFGCASYCQHAEQCLGSLPPEVLAQQDNLFRNRLEIEVKKQMLTDDQGYELITQRAKFAEILCKQENGNMPVVLASSLLSKIEEPVAVMTKMRAKEDLVKEVENLLGNKTLGSDLEKHTSSIFHDACLLADIAQGDTSISPDDFQTKAGKNEGEKLLEANIN